MHFSILITSAVHDVCVFCACWGLHRTNMLSYIWRIRSAARASLRLQFGYRAWPHCDFDFSSTLTQRQTTHFIYMEMVKTIRTDSERWSKSGWVKERQRKREERDRARQRVFKHPWHSSLGLVPTLVSYWCNWAMTTHPHGSKQKNLLTSHSLGPI